MQHCKFQILKSTDESRGYLLTFVKHNYDYKIVTKDTIEDERILIFSNPIVDGFEVLKQHPNLKYLYIDNGYLGNHLKKRPNYYRISYNSLQNSDIKPVLFSRANKIPFGTRPWSSNGNYNLLVCPGKTSPVWSFTNTNYSEWKQEMIDKFDNLKIREKEGPRYPRFKTLWEDIADAKKVIVYHSMTAVEAMMLGKEVHVSGHSAVELYSNKYNYNRQPVIEHIAWSQFSRDEFLDGTAWQLTYEYQMK